MKFESLQADPESACPTIGGVPKIITTYFGAFMDSVFKFTSGAAVTNVIAETLTDTIKIGIFCKEFLKPISNRKENMKNTNFRGVRYPCR